MTIYIVTDMRTVADGSAVTITSTQHTSRMSADMQFFTKAAAAANPGSQYPVHSVILCTNEGFVIDTKSYVHEVQGA